MTIKPFKSWYVAEVRLYRDRPPRKFFDSNRKVCIAKAEAYLGEEMSKVYQECKTGRTA